MIFVVVEVITIVVSLTTNYNDNDHFDNNANDNNINDFSTN